jgi:alkylated DNA repair protein (DNA oxidative demethylase)
MAREAPDRLLWLAVRLRDGKLRAGPIPDWLLPLREKAAGFARLAPGDLVQALLIRYDPGAGIGSHRDRSVFEHVIGVSLGASATMRFRRRRSGGFDRASASLALRSIYHMTGRLGTNRSTVSARWR